ncbi:MAG TPA: ROK family protein, partial [Acidimicrobiales bacterium]|nr:ROK family protein [Acidimicrobiales bacterium]
MRAATRGVDDMEFAHGTCCQGGTTVGAGMDIALAVDIGGTKMAAGLVSDDGEVLASATAPSRADSADGLFGVLAGLVDGVRGSAEVAVCGVGCGGPMTAGGE